MHWRRDSGFAAFLYRGSVILSEVEESGVVYRLYYNCLGDKVFVDPICVVISICGKTDFNEEILSESVAVDVIIFNTHYKNKKAKVLKADWFCKQGFDTLRGQCVYHCKW